jgi:SAM-dependent methyltransferase
VSEDKDPRAALRRLYRDLDGFEIPRDDARRIARSKGSSIYGELMPTATIRLLTHLELGRRDRFVDLGSGAGKVVLLAAMTTEVASALGVELSASRVAVAEQALARARAEGLPGAERASFVEADMLRHPLDEATVIYTCSTAFSTAFMRRLTRRLAELPKLRAVASLQDFDPHPAFELAEVYKLDASWKRNTKVYVYERVRASKSRRRRGAGA